jgi:hypothetical protein
VDIESYSMAQLVLASFSEVPPPLAIADDKAYDSIEIDAAFRPYLNFSNIESMNYFKFIDFGFDIIHLTYESSIPDELIRYNRSAIYSFTPQAWIFFMPKFVACGILNPQSEILDGIAYFFSSSPPYNEFYLRRISLLDGYQREAIILALYFFRSKFCANDAYLSEKIKLSISNIKSFRGMFNLNP